MHGQRPARELISGQYCCIPDVSLLPVCIYAQNIFVAVNFEEESNTTEAGENDDSAMLRFEFYEAIVRASMSRCSTSLQTCDVSDSTQTFIAQVRLNAIIPSCMHSSGLEQARVELRASQTCQANIINETWLIYYYASIHQSDHDSRLHSTARWC